MELFVLIVRYIVLVKKKKLICSLHTVRVLHTMLRSLYSAYMTDTGLLTAFSARSDHMVPRSLYKVYKCAYYSVFSKELYRHLWLSATTWLIIVALGPLASS